MKDNQTVKKVCLIGASFNNDNLGVEALAYGMLRTVVHRYPNASVFILDYREQPANFSIKIANNLLDIPVVNLRFSKKLMLQNNIAMLLAKAMLIRCIPMPKIREAMAVRNPYFKHIKEADLVLSISGGDSFSDIYGMKRMLYVSLPQLLILLLEKPLTLMPQTIGPFKGRLSRWIARTILAAAETVFSRDEEGVEYTRELLGERAADARIRFSPDVAFVVEPASFEARSIPGGIERLRQDNRPVVGLNVSGLLYMGGYNHRNMFELKDDYRDLVQQLGQFLIVEKNAHIVLIPHVLGDEANVESDRHACREVYHVFKAYQDKQLYLVQGAYRANEIKHLIGRCDFFLGSRLHACIGALSQCVPSVALAYSRKFEGVLQSVNAGSFVIDLRSMTNREVVSEVDRLFDGRDALRQGLNANMPHIKNRALNLFSLAVDR